MKRRIFKSFVEFENIREIFENISWDGKKIMSEILLEKLKAKMKIEPEKAALSLENFIREYNGKLEREGAILGLSGGIDSAVVAALCVRALGPKKTFALIMPEKDSKKEQIRT